jgi:hypothetical protein
VSSSLCRDNGFRYENGTEQWDRVKAWSEALVRKNIGYRIVRSPELADSNALIAEKTPLILDGTGCVSQSQFEALKTYLSKGGKAWLSLPYGTHDEKGFRRDVPLSSVLTSKKYKNLVIMDSVSPAETLNKLTDKGLFKPLIRQVSGDKGWTVRIHLNENKPVFHFLNAEMKPVPHPAIKDNGGTPILKDIDSDIINNKISYEIDSRLKILSPISLLSPESGDRSGNVEISRLPEGSTKISFDLTGIKIYAVGQ